MGIKTVTSKCHSGDSDTPCVLGRKLLGLHIYSLAADPRNCSQGQVALPPCLPMVRSLSPLEGKKAGFQLTLVLQQLDIRPLTGESNGVKVWEVGTRKKNDMIV